MLHLSYFSSGATYFSSSFRTSSFGASYFSSSLLSSSRTLLIGNSSTPVFYGDSTGASIDLEDGPTGAYSGFSMSRTESCLLYLLFCVFLLPSKAMFSLGRFVVSIITGDSSS